MNDIAIHVEGVSKLYRIGQGRRASYKTLRDLISNMFAQSVRRLIPHKTSQRFDDQSDSEVIPQSIWALNDISFDVERGEIVGIIGPNGAGKSTLLKILTRITEPTEGSIDIFGRVGSLLEVGTGFHKELTGRENVYLNGAILGMKKAEIDHKFDEIVDFAEVEKFIDTPVKFYSSGMQVRLAFAVAAHLEPEILLVDEVLAVGDAAFQRKCLNKMEDVGKEGRTVLFVSHHMPSVTRLCEKTMLLDNGNLVMNGPTQEVVGEYLKATLRTTPARKWDNLETAPGNDIVRLRSIRIKSESGEIVDTIDIRQPVIVELEHEVLKPGYVLYPGFTLHNEEGLWVFASLDTDSQWLRKPRPVGCYISRARIPGNMLAEGTMIIGSSVRTEEPRIIHYYERDAVALQVVEMPGSLTARVDMPGRFPGVVRPLLEWETEYNPKY
jgi:lipopolysaccharide transport system ATP-binding protein